MEPTLSEMFSLTQYFEPELDPMWVAVWCYVVAWLLFIFNIVACVWIVILAIVALLCSLPCRVVR